MNPFHASLRQRLLSFVPKFTMLCFGFLLLTATAKVSAQATLTTDQEDYPPGGIVTLTGSGFQAGETVQLQVLHHDENGDNDESAAHQPWIVTAAGDGSFVTTWNVPA